MGKLKTVDVIFSPKSTYLHQCIFGPKKRTAGQNVGWHEQAAVLRSAFIASERQAYIFKSTDPF